MVIVALMMTQVFALTPKEEKGVKVLKLDTLVYEAPEWVTPFTLDTAPDDIEYWKWIIPFEDDRDEDMYIVMPTIWVAAPIQFVPEDTADFDTMVAGYEIDINKYLSGGVMHHPNSGIPGEVGNPVIFWHSNFFKDGVGDYKTIFADIMNLDAGSEDEIRFFVRQIDGEYELRKFAIEKSYETVPTDIGVLNPTGWKEITVYACTNGLAWRWILKWRYIEQDEMLVPYVMKWYIEDLLERMSQLNPAARQQIVETMTVQIKATKDTLTVTNTSYHDKFTHYLLNYMQKKLIEMY